MIPGLKVVFLGTSQFAVPALRSLFSDDSIELSAVVSRPDRPAGRGRKLRRPPVAAAAEELGIRLLQPEKLKEIKNDVAEIAPVVMVSASYGGWLPEWFLGCAPMGVINIHPSLLPRHRGAAPVIRTILEGDSETGVCFMLTDNGWDTGDIIKTIRCTVTGKETALVLEEALADRAAEALPGVIKGYVSGKLSPRHQQGPETYAEKVIPPESVIHWNTPSDQICRMIRAFNPVPGARTQAGSKLLKIYSAEACADRGIPGQVLGTDPLVVACGTGSVSLLEVQPQGKRRMTAQDYVRGYRVQKGATLGEA